MGTAAAVGETFGFNTWAFVAQLLSFSIVCAVLYKFAYHPILKLLEDRRTQIELTYREAAAIKVQVADAERRANDIVVQASSGAHKIVEEAKVAAQEFHEKQIQQAKQDAEDLVAKAREATKRDYDRMLAASEDAEDVAAFDESMAEQGADIPWDQVRADLGWE